MHFVRFTHCAGRRENAPPLGLALVVSNKVATIEILPGIGLSNIQFGLDEKEVVMLLGNQTKYLKLTTNVSAFNTIN